MLRKCLDGNASSLFFYFSPLTSFLFFGKQKMRLMETRLLFEPGFSLDVFASVDSEKINKEKS